MNAYSEAGDECLRKQPALTRHTDPNDVGIVISYGKIPAQVEGSVLVLSDRGEGLTGRTQSLVAMTHQTGYQALRPVVLSQTYLVSASGWVVGGDRSQEPCVFVWPVHMCCLMQCAVWSGESSKIHPAKCTDLLRQ